jgi:ribosome biogenesis GTPase A
VTVKPEDYINILSKIKDEFALAIILVDLLDFPCSIWPDIKEILGDKRPVFIVGNKVDLIPKDHSDYLNHMKDCLRDYAMNLGFKEKHIRHISLISAKTGYGIEELITKLHSVWKYKGDVYLIGCTNVGKSSLFNALLKSDYCKVEASNIVQKATASIWPGTTLKMLKFPILRPSDYRIFERTQRLISEKAQKFAEEKLRRDQANTSKKAEHATLIGHIGQTFAENKVGGDPFAFTHQSGFTQGILTLNEKSDRYKLSKWCYDTPGVVQPDQVRCLKSSI